MSLSKKQFQEQSNRNINFENYQNCSIQTANTAYQKILTDIANDLEKELGFTELRKIETAIKKLIKKHSKSGGVWQLKGKFLEKQQKFEEAIQAFQKASILDPSNWAPPFNIGNLYCRLRDNERGIEYLKKSLNLAPESYLVLSSLGRVLFVTGKKDEAYNNIKKSLLLKADNPAALLELSRIMLSKKNHEQAIQAIELAIKYDSNNGLLYDQKGWILSTLNYKEKALEYFEKAHSFRPKDRNILLNLCNALVEIGSYRDAIQRASCISPNEPEFCNFLYFRASAHQRIGEYQEGLSCIVKAIQLLKNNAYYHNMHGVLLTCLGDHENAKLEFENAIALNPNLSNPYNNLGNYFKDRGQNQKAYECYFNAFQADPGDSLAAVGMFNQARLMCDWGKANNVVKLMPNLGIDGKAANVFPLISMEDDPKKQMARSVHYSNEIYKHILEIPGVKFSDSNKKIKVGYFSADFHNHATLFLMSGLFRNHDHEKFEIFCFSYGDVQTGNLRTDVQKHSQKFFDVSMSTDLDIVKLARNTELDIAIDLKGYTKDNRSGLFKYRLAPIQINYLGFPSTMGADFIDYIVADPVVIPAEYEKCYSEKIITLPNSYQPNDNLRRISDKNFTRKSCDLPEDMFVFCCMNNTYKINENEFEIWIRILKKVERSVLWLQSSDANVMKNLKKKLENSGIDNDRLIFAPGVEHSEHLRRLQNADLFMDTFFYNAHTTASDALWAGVPVVTKIGKQFAARVGASLVSAVGLKELITTSDEEYENLIIELATNPGKLAEVKNRLQTNIEKTPLFNTEQYTKHFEIALEKAFYLKKNENKVQDIVIEN